MRGLRISAWASRMRWALASRRHGGARAHLGQHAHRHRRDLAIDGGEPRRPPRLLGRRPLVVADDVVPQILRMKPHSLRHDADLPAHLLEVELLKVPAVVVDRTAGRLFQPEREPQQGALPGPGRAGDGDELTRAGRDRYLVEDQRPVRFAAEGDPVEHDLAPQFAPGTAPSALVSGVSASSGRIWFHAGTIAASAPNDSPRRMTAR